MGANTFGDFGTGKTAQEAFNNAVNMARREAEYEAEENGETYEGYSGTIAEKRNFIMISVPKDQDPVKYAHALLDADDARISDKWGPAGCVKVSEDTWYFFGWASS